MLAVEGDSAFGFSGMEVETICRYDLPVCIVVFNNNGIYRGTDTDPTGRDPATTVFVPDSRYNKMMEAFGGVGYHVTTPDELTRAVNEAMNSGRPALINAVIDPAAGSEPAKPAAASQPGPAGPGELSEAELEALTSPDPAVRAAARQAIDPSVLRPNVFGSKVQVPPPGRQAIKRTLRDGPHARWT